MEIFHYFMLYFTKSSLYSCNMYNSISFSAVYVLYVFLYTCTNEFRYVFVFGIDVLEII